MFTSNLKKFASIPFRTTFLSPAATRSFTKINQKVCHYEVLEIKPNATSAEIKMAYYKKVKLYHPDHNHTPGAEEKFKVIAKAYETLKDPISRQIYDLSKSNPNFNVDEDSGPTGGSPYARYYASNTDQADANRKDYYNNKWYGFGKKKATEDTLRDEYYSVKDKNAMESIFDNFVVRVAIVVGVILAFDMWQKYRRGKHNQFVDTQKEILMGSSALGSPLVFIKEKPVEEKQKSERAEVDLDDYIDYRKKKVQEEENAYHNEF